MPTLLRRLDEPIHPLTQEEHRQSPPTREPTLLERMNASGSSTNLKNQSFLLEKGRTRKRTLSPLSSESSGRTLMSRLLNNKRRRLSTPISQKSSQSNHLATDKLETQSGSHGQLINSPTHVSSDRNRRKRVKPSNPTLMKTMKGIQSKGESLLSPTCHGTLPQMSQPLVIATPVAKKPVGFCEHTIETSPRQNSLLKSPPILHRESLPLSGNVSSKEKQSTSTISLRHSTMLSLMKRGRVAWEMQRSALESLNQRSASQLRLSGVQRGGKHRKLLVSPSLTGEKSYSTTETTSRPSSLPKLNHPITNSSSTMSHCGTKLGQANSSCSQTSTASPDCTPPLSYQTESSPSLQPLKERSLGRVKHLPLEERLKSATNSMPAHAKISITTASTGTSAKPAANRDTQRGNVRKGPSEIYGLQPKYLRHNLWDDTSFLSPTTADWSERAVPLVLPSAAEISNPISAKTVAANPHLFKVLTPIKVDVFEALLKDHPNPAFVHSVCLGL